ncbi:minor tail protein [Arthrobacter phage Idaho]|uniref:Minor tail protein n=1 Tax=Arthrobacter phage Idaho TaxID=2565509 RepID=A0A4D6T845_9CAUD|nr:minor tail protein [Arthrobacter phage Idaho]QCG78276.1 minor tail protein [Arthrobacter phage Idaho]
MGNTSAELLPVSGAVRLSINTLSGIRRITRADANGINDVRALPGTYGKPTASKPGRTNLIMNPSFEVDNAGWSLDGVTTVLQSAFPQMTQAGTKMIQCSADGTRAAPGISIISASYRPQVVEGQWLGIQVFMATENANYQTRLQIGWQDATGTTLSYVATPWKATPFYAGDKPRLVLQAPAGTASIKVYLQFRNGDDSVSFVPAGKRMWADGCMAFVAATEAAATAALDAGYFDGATANDDGRATSWAGTAHLSQSLELVPESPLVITDYEPASGPLRYDVEPMSGNLETLDVSGFELGGPWLFTPIIPGYSRPLVLVQELASNYTSNTTVHDGLLGRDDPIAVMRPLGMRRGTMKIFAGTIAQALELLTPLRQATVMMLRQPDHAGLDMYFAAESAELIHYDQDGPATLWGVSITYVEVKRPEGDLAGALGWTYLDLLSATPRYSDQRRTFATYADMRLNKRKP